MIRGERRIGQRVGESLVLRGGALVLLAPPSQVGLQRAQPREAFEAARGGLVEAEALGGEGGGLRLRGERIEGGPVDAALGVAPVDLGGDGVRGDDGLQRRAGVGDRALGLREA